MLESIGSRLFQYHSLTAVTAGCRHFVYYSVHSDLKEYAHKDYLSLQKKGVGETNILQQIQKLRARLAP